MLKNIGVVVTHPTGNLNVRYLLQALTEQEFLNKFATTVGFTKSFDPPGVLNQKIRSELMRRRYEVRKDLIVRFPLFESCRLMAERCGIKSLVKHEKGVFCIDSVCRRLDLSVSKRLFKERSASHLYCYEDAAVESLRAASQVGIVGIYELPIGYWRYAKKIMSEEADLQPEWAMTISGLRDSQSKLQTKDEEISACSKMVVASSFTKRSLQMYPGTLPAVHVVPYCFPPSADHFRQAGKTLKVLYVGSLGQRKGISYLAAVRSMLKESVEMTVIGKRPDTECRALDLFLGQVRYIASAPHDEILAEMANHDVFVFPTLFEGFGLVIAEAMSRGMAVIATSHSCAEDVIKDGVNGFVVPIRDPEMIAERIRFLDKNRDVLEGVRRNALGTGRFHNFELYKKTILEVFAA